MVQAGEAVPRRVAESRIPRRLIGAPLASPRVPRNHAMNSPQPEERGELRRRIAVLRAEIQSAEEKRTGLVHAIQARRITLQRLEAQLAMIECAPACDNHA